MTSYLWSFGVVCEILMFIFKTFITKNNLLNVIKFCLGITIFWVLLYLYPDSLNVTFLMINPLMPSLLDFNHSAVIMYLYSLYENKN